MHKCRVHPPSHIFVFVPLSRPPYNITSPTVLTFSAVCYAPAQTVVTTTLVTATDGAHVCICTCAYVRRVYAVIGTQADHVERAVFCFQKRSRSAKQSQNQYTAEQHSSSDTAAAVFQTLAFVPVGTMHVCVAGAQQQEIKPRQHQHVRYNSGQTHIVRPHIRCKRSTKQRMVLLCVCMCVLLYVGCVLSQA